MGISNCSKELKFRNTTLITNMDLINKLKRQTFSKIEDISESTYNKLVNWIVNKEPHLKDLKDAIDQINCTVSENQQENNNTLCCNTKRQFSPLIVAIIGSIMRRSNDLKRSINPNSNGIVVEGKKKEDFLNVFGMYWNIMNDIRKALRYEKNSKESMSTMGIREASLTKLHENISKAMNLDPKNIVYVHKADRERFDTHSPDFVVAVIHQHRQILINICGTRMVPAPSMPDIVMNLLTNNEEFVIGKAHSGMVIGCKNVYTMIKDKLLCAMDENPQYGLLISGYSLGGGIGQLLTIYLMELQKEKKIAQVQIRCLAFAAPPVLDDPVNKKYPNIFLIRNNNDVVPTLSLYSGAKLINQIRAVKKLDIGLRDMIELYRNRREFNYIYSEDEDLEVFIESKDSTITKIAQLENLLRIRQAIADNVINEPKTQMLNHPSGAFFELCLKTGSVEIKSYLGDTKALAKNVCLRKSMFNDHMPWNYGKLFQNVKNQGVTIEEFESVLSIFNFDGILEYSSRLYPNLNNLSI